MRLPSSIAISVLLLCMHLSAFSQQTAVPPDAERAFRSGNALMGEKKYCDALTRYKEGLTSGPDDTSLLYNGGMAAFQCQQYAVAVDLWRHLKALDPADWQTRAKLIQAFQALGKSSEREEERAALFDLRKQDSSGDLAKQIEYCRDQFEAAGEKVMAFENFELKGDRAVRYVFSIIDKSKQEEKYRLSLGSYDTTNAVWHETTKPRPKEILSMLTSRPTVAGSVLSCCAAPIFLVPIPISNAVFLGNTTSFPRAMKCEYSDIPAPYAPIV